MVECGHFEPEGDANCSSSDFKSFKFKFQCCENKQW